MSRLILLQAEAGGPFSGKDRLGRPEVSINSPSGEGGGLP